MVTIQCPVCDGDVTLDGSAPIYDGVKCASCGNIYSITYLGDGDWEFIWVDSNGIEHQEILYKEGVINHAR